MAGFSTILVTLVLVLRVSSLQAVRNSDSDTENLNEFLGQDNILRKVVPLDKTAVTSYNDLLNAKGIFPPQINSFTHSKLKNEDALILSNLKTVLQNPKNLQLLYGQYKTKFAITPKDEKKSLTIFQNKLIDIATHNLEARRGKHLWEKGVNQFTDITREEFIAQHLGLLPEKLNAAAPYNSNSTRRNKRKNRLQSIFSTAPKAIDWVALNKVSPVKHQQNCGSCVLFATAALLDSTYAIKHGLTGTSVPNFSPQELLDCTNPFQDTCKTGTHYEVALKYAKENGVSKLESYPLTSTGYKDLCRKNKISKFASIKSYSKISGGEKGLKDAVAKGPCAVTIRGIQDYDHGIYQGNECLNAVPGNLHNYHAILVVGYGTVNDHKFWKLKNSWGTTWGEQGYLRMARYENTCEIGSLEKYTVKME